LKTIDDLWSGHDYSEAVPGKKSQKVERVEYTFDSVVLEMERDPEKTFSFTEVKWIKRWYSRQTKEKQASFKSMVQNGRLEVTMGGWSASDEACPEYTQLINNMYFGHQWLKKEFGVVPKVGWMVDSFGHSASNAALFADFGFDAMFIGRMDKE
jgi:alpha-mannosidase